jgi:hypothetical protein
MYWPVMIPSLSPSRITDEKLSDSVKWCQSGIAKAQNASDPVRPASALTPATVR